MAGDDDYEAMKAAVMDVVGEHFRPEFINRIDDLVVFHPLDRAQIRSIVDIQLAGLRKRLVERDLEFEVSDEAMDQLAEAGFDPVYGARPLKRAIQQQLENPLAEAILRGDFVPGDAIAVTLEGAELRFVKATSAAA
jgi:ATP-dependent Clp protease ATP-binding subunit ClpB